VSAQPVDAMPFAINFFSKDDVYESWEMGKAFRDTANQHMAALESLTVVS
jgi:hypothetical protein